MKSRKKFSFPGTAPLALALGLAACASPAPGPVSPPTATGPGDKTLVALYMVGSNLEDDVKPRNGRPDEAESGAISPVGAGSFDLQEIVDGWQALSPAARSRLEILVAFGGARKQGWQGVKYADIGCLQSDSADGYFGNADCYSYRQAEANMATSETLIHFLSYLKQHHADKGRKVLDIWNHGLAFLGAGYDSTQTKPTDYITLPEMKQAFSAVPLHFDLLAFDACLMGSLEVAQSVSGFADYMLASEEIEPAHGWHYGSVLESLALGTQTALSTIGKKLVDAYLDHPDHQHSNSNLKTLSLLDLRQVTAVRSALDSLVSQLDPGSSDSFAAVLQTLNDSQHFGSEPASGVSYGIDLRHWAEGLKARQPQLGTATDSLIQALGKLVLHARHDANKPNANGLSIYSLNQKLSTRYGREQSVSDNWLGFTRSFIARGQNDTARPSVSASNSFKTAQESADKLCEQNGRRGHCLDITDNLGLASVEQVFGIKADQRYLFSIGSVRLKPTASQADQYFAPVWDGEWFLVCDGDCSTGKSLFPPAYFESQTETGNRIYSAEAVLNGLSVVFYLEVGRNNGVVRQWAVPYEVGSAGEIILTREQFNIKAGDSLNFLYQVYDLQTRQMLWKAGEALTFSHTPVWSYARIDGPRAYLVSARDASGQLGLSPLYEVR